jgi:hypothetical protein
VAVDFNGVIRGTDDPMGTWDEVGRVNGSPAAIEGVGDELLVAHTRLKCSRPVMATVSWNEILRP